MPSYPTSVKVFTTKNTGDVIQASHVNDLQDEVNALETGILQGTAPITSSNITCAELFVTREPPFVMTGASAAQQIANNAITAVTFDVNRFISTASMHSTSANTERVVPPSSGVYQVIGDVHWASGTTGGSKTLDVYLNSTSVLVRNSVSPPANAGGFSQQVSLLYRLQTTDTIELRVTQTSGSTGSLALVGNSPFLSMVKVR